MELSRNWRPPAITTGLVLFYILLYVLDLTDTLKLTPNALFRIDLNRLSFYPLVFFDAIHLILGVLFFTPLCGQYELSNGTVRTGVMLNITAFFVGILDNIIVKVSGDRVGVTDFCGTSSWILAFSAFLSVRNWTLPIIPMGRLLLTIPPWILPIIFYAIMTAFAPAYWLVHLLAMLMGFGLGTGHLGFLIEGTTTVIAWIESKLEKGINYLRYIVHFVDEVEARELRRLTAMQGRRTSITPDDIPLPAASLTSQRT